MRVEKVGNTRFYKFQESLLLTDLFGSPIFTQALTGNHLFPLPSPPLPTHIHTLSFRPRMLLRTVNVTDTDFPFVYSKNKNVTQVGLAFDMHLKMIFFLTLRELRVNFMDFCRLCEGFLKFKFKYK